MTWFAILVHPVAGGPPTCCAVAADRTDVAGDRMVAWAGDRVVYAAPAAAVARVVSCASAAEARQTLSEWQRSAAARGRLGEEQAGIRPAAGGRRQVGHVVEGVRAVTAARGREP